MSPEKKRWLLPIILACTTVLFAVLFFQASAPDTPSVSADTVTAYQEQIDELEAQNAQLQSEIDTLTAENATQATELDNRQTQIDDLTAKNAEQATELANRQTQIDDLWARVDAAQKNLDAAYAQVEARQTTSSTSAAQPSSGQSTSQTVYITNTGSKYHRAGCQYLRQSQIAISLEKAKSQGYTACSRCF